MKSRRALIPFVVAALAGLALQPPGQFTKPQKAQVEFAKHQKAQVEKLPDNPKLTGRFVPGGRGGPALATPDGKLLLLKDADRYRDVPAGLSVEVTAAKDDGQLKVTGWQPKLVASWHDTESKKFTVSKYPELHEAYANLKEVSDELNKKGMGVVRVNKLADALKGVSDATLNAYMKLPENEHGTATAKSLCQQHEEARRQYQKAIYGRIDNYRPEVYQRIYESSKSAVAVAVRRGLWDPIGSGVLIGDGLVLTCNHVVDGQQPADLQIWFDFNGGAGGFAPLDAFPVTQIVFQGKAPEAGRPPLDFALLRLGPNEKGEKAETKYPRPTISTHHVHRDDAIYVVGFPDRKPRTVHDNAFVLFPFLASEREYVDLRMYVCAETQNSPDRTAELELFIKSYVLNKLKNLYEYYSGRWNCPTISADCDTYQGNSGSGAYDRLGSKLIGLLMGGDRDGGGRRLTPGWRHHEDILPIAAVIDQLDANLKDWQKTYNVKVDQ
jgi:V8-like Glu-specific endopeptidase